VIVVKIEMWPGGDQSKAYPIAVGVIVNDGTGTKSKGNYEFSLGLKRPNWRVGKVFDYPRQRLNVWHLLHEVLDVATSSK
jgi:hypothetical protein